MQIIISISTYAREALYDITNDVEKIVASSNIEAGLVNVYVRGATAGIMIQENWDQSVQTDVIHLFQKLVPQGVWLHDQQDGNGDSHLKAGIVGPQETIPIMNGEMALSTWQNIFLCEFDGPRKKRDIVLTLISTST
jgi:secondary thiamine-phosphate synthase enzyme